MQYTLVALKNDMPDMEMIPKESHMRDHAANGQAENAINEIKRQVRVVKERHGGRATTTCFRQIIQFLHAYRDTV